MAGRRRARRLIMQALYQWQLNDAEVLDIIRQFREENSKEGSNKDIDWEFFEEFIKEIPRQREALESHFEKLLDRKVDSLDPVERALLYLGTFELAHRLDVPYRVVINECVELAKIFGATESHKYINGVLDKLAQELRPLEIGNKRKSSA